MAAAAHLLVMTVAPELALHLVRGRQHQVAGAVVPAPHHLIAERDVQILAAADAALLVQVAVALLAPVLVPATADRIVPANAALTVPVPALLLAALPAPAAVAAAVLLIVPIHVPAPPKQLVTHVLPHANKHVHRHAAQPAPAIVHLPVTVIVSQHVKDVAPALHIVLRDQVVQITDAISSAQTPVMQNVMVHVM